MTVRSETVATIVEFHGDYGKNAHTFVRRSDGRAVRVSGRPLAETSSAATPTLRSPEA